VLEEVVERPDAPREQRGTPPQEVALDPLDVDAVGDDEPGIVSGIAVERAEIPLQKQRNLAGVSRPNHERKRHRTMVVPASDAPSYAAGSLHATLRKEREMPADGPS
jgi:hypothetical protein